MTTGGALYRSVPRDQKRNYKMGEGQMGGNEINWEVKARPKPEQEEH
jgi:hypothetical protein